MSNRKRTDVVRGLELRRRRSRVPWIYLVYHVRESGHREDRITQKPQTCTYPEANCSVPSVASELSESVASVASESPPSVGSTLRSDVEETRGRPVEIPVR